MTNVKELSAWKKLEAHKKTALNKFFYPLINNERFNSFSLRLDGLLYDYSKNLILPETLELLIDLAKECSLEEKRRAMFAGEKINTSENRAVLHSNLRSPNPADEVKSTLEKMAVFAEKLYSESKITDIVNIGIGGSSLGPELATKALKQYHHKGLKAHYISNVEASHLYDVLGELNPETTLFIIASKTFTTAETMQNAKTAKQWFFDNAPNLKIFDHFIAVSTNIEAAKEFGISKENIFPMWEWVGGRYSLWSAISISTFIMIGAGNFKEFLNGAHTMDEHFKTVPLDKNLPVIMALIGIWYINFCGRSEYAVIPYHSRLQRLPAWLQQLDMESNGKMVKKDGSNVDCATGPTIFGEPGTDSQHSFFQHLHQGTEWIPVDFIACINPSCGSVEQHHMLLANCLAQSEALISGNRNADEPHRDFIGNRPSSTILLDELTPYNLGMLLALYEHKIFVQGAIWDINSFDQWGVELGKLMAKALQKELLSKETKTHDGSTTGLMRYILDKQKN